MVIPIILGIVTLLVLAGSGASAGTPAPIIGFSVRQWEPYIRKLFTTGRVPASVGMAWMQVESGGNPCAVGLFGIPPQEYGLFQLNFDGDSGLGNRTQMRVYCQNTGTTRKDLEHQVRQLTEAEKLQQVQSGLNLIQKCRDAAGKVAEKAGIGWGQADRWKLVKMYHNVPTWVGLLVNVKQKLGFPPASFAEYRRTIENNPSSFGITTKPGRIAEIFNLAESVGNAL